jgi:hypothetical protein
MKDFEALYQMYLGSSRILYRNEYHSIVVHLSVFDYQELEAQGKIVVDKWHDLPVQRNMRVPSASFFTEFLRDHVDISTELTKADIAKKQVADFWNCPKGKHKLFVLRQLYSAEVDLQQAEILFNAAKEVYLKVVSDVSNAGQQLDQADRQFASIRQGYEKCVSRRNTLSAHANTLANKWPAPPNYEPNLDWDNQAGNGFGVYSARAKS